jgi:SNF2 family DNA or RNA helicase
VAVDAGAEPRLDAPLYHSPRGVYTFQAEGTAHIYYQRDCFVKWDCGIGKGHMAMQLAALLFEDGLIDLVIVGCEQNKLKEWKDDFDFYTKLDARLYYGSKQQRAKQRAELPQVLISTYETIRNDAVYHPTENGKVNKRKFRPGVFTEWVHRLRVLFIYDEVTKLQGRGSQTHKAHDHLVSVVRKESDASVIGMSGTMGNPEALYNMMRIIRPGLLGTVQEFERDHVATKDYWGNTDTFKNTDETNHFNPEVPLLREKLGACMITKSKADPDVRDEFPERIEQFTHVELNKLQDDFYRTVSKEFKDSPGLFVLQRQIAGDPRACMRSDSDLAKKLVKIVGVEGLEKIGSPKLEYLVEYLKPITGTKKLDGQGAQVVVFDFFGQSVLPWVYERLCDEGFTVAFHHGELSQSEKEFAKHQFRSGQVQILLTSDAGQRGINLPEASYVVQYGLPLTYSSYIQRMDRAHRIDSIHDSLTNRSIILGNTVEAGIVKLVLDANRWDESVYDDGSGLYLTVKEREELVSVSSENPFGSQSYIDSYLQEAA